MEITFRGEVWYWRGPSPFHFVTVPGPECALLREAASLVSYGWGMVPVTATIGSTTWTTSLFPKDGAYIVPLRDAIRRAEAIRLGVTVEVTLAVVPRDR